MFVVAAFCGTVSAAAWPQSDPSASSLVVEVRAVRTLLIHGAPVQISIDLRNRSARELAVGLKCPQDEVKLTIRSQLGNVIEPSTSPALCILSRNRILHLASGEAVALASGGSNLLDLRLWGYHLSPGTFSVFAARGLGSRSLPSQSSVTVTIQQ